MGVVAGIPAGAALGLDAAALTGLLLYPHGLGGPANGQWLLAGAVSGAVAGPILMCLAARWEPIGNPRGSARGRPARRRRPRINRLPIQPQKRQS